MTRLIIISILSVFTLFCSCQKVKVSDTLIQIYKFKSIDYSNNAPVELSMDKTKITSHSSELNIRWPIKLDSGYYLNGSMDVNSGYLSYTIEEYNSLEPLPGVDVLYSKLIESDPYLEYYQRNDDGTFSNENGANGIDTVMINGLIRTGKLENYFERLK